MQGLTLDGTVKDGLTLLQDAVFAIEHLQEEVRWTE